MAKLSFNRSNRVSDWNPPPGNRTSFSFVTGDNNNALGANVSESNSLIGTLPNRLSDDFNVPEIPSLPRIEEKNQVEKKRISLITVPKEDPNEKKRTKICQ